MKVRITEKPRERELEGLRLDTFIAGTVRNVSSLIGAWLITQGYAVAEMRATGDEDQWFGRVNPFPAAPPGGAKRRVAY